MYFVTLKLTLVLNFNGYLNKSNPICYYDKKTTFILLCGVMELLS